MKVYVQNTRTGATRRVLSPEGAVVALDKDEEIIRTVPEVETPEFGSTPMGPQVRNDIMPEPPEPQYDYAKEIDRAGGASVASSLGWHTPLAPEVPSIVAYDLETLHKNVYTDILALNEKLDEVEEGVEEIGNSLIEQGIAMGERLARQAAGRQEGLRAAMALITELRADVNRIAENSVKITRNLTQSIDLNDEAVAALAERVEALEEFRTNTIEDINDLDTSRDRLSSLESPAFEEWMSSMDKRLTGVEDSLDVSGLLDEFKTQPGGEVNDDAEEWNSPEVRAYNDDGPVSDANFLRYLTTRYQLPRFVCDSLQRIADEIERGQRRPS